MTVHVLKRSVRAAAIAGLLLAGFAAALVYGLSERKLNTRYDVPADVLAVSTAGADPQRGAHLVEAVGSCTLCHGKDLGGGVYADMGAVGLVAGPNLTRGRGGVGATFQTSDWVRALRYGVRADGTSLIMMPSEVFTRFSDEDLSSIVAYLNSLAPIDREVPKSHFRWLGRTLLAAGRLEILVAPKTHHESSMRRVVNRTPSIEYGRYLADVSGCHGCHGFGLSGGRVAGPPNLPPAANLTPAGLGAWKEDDFIRAMREGRRPDGTPIDEFMPWRGFATMSADELHALWLYITSVPPKASGNK